MSDEPDEPDTLAWEIPTPDGEFRSYTAEVLNRDPWQFRLTRLDTGGVYTTSQNAEGSWQCECSDFLYKGYLKRGEDSCKHCLTAIGFAAARDGEWPIPASKGKQVVDALNADAPAGQVIHGDYAAREAAPPAPAPAPQNGLVPRIQSPAPPPAVRKLPPGIQLRTFAEVLEFAAIVAKSGLYPDIRSASMAAIKIMYGAEMGFGPCASLAGIDIIEGRPSLGAFLCTSLFDDSPDHDAEILQLTDDVCEVRFWRWTGIGTEYRKQRRGWKALGTIRQTMADAVAKKWQLTESGKEKPAYKKTPKNMLYARVITNGRRFYGSTLGRSVKTYDPDEIDGIEEVSQLGGSTHYQPDPTDSYVGAQPPTDSPDAVTSPEAAVSTERPERLDRLSRVQMGSILRLLGTTNLDSGAFRMRLHELYRTETIANLTPEQAADFIARLESRKAKATTTP